MLIDKPILSVFPFLTLWILLQDDDQSSDNETVQTNTTGTVNEQQGVPSATAVGPMPPIAPLKPANNAEKPLLR